MRPENTRVCSVGDTINIRRSANGLIMKYNHNSFKLYLTTNNAFIDVYVRRLNSAAIAIIEFQLRSVDYMGDQLAIRLRSMQLNSDMFVLWTDRHGPLCKGVNRQWSWRPRRSVRYHQSAKILYTPHSTRRRSAPRSAKTLINCWLVSNWSPRSPSVDSCTKIRGDLFRAQTDRYLIT